MSDDPGPAARQGSGPRPTTSARFDRVARPDPALRRERDGTGKEALYSTSPSARPAQPVEVWCRRCDVQLGLSMVGSLKLLRPPWLLNPVDRRLWTRCPACSRHAWLQVRPGPPLRALLDRPGSPRAQ